MNCPASRSIHRLSALVVIAAGAMAGAAFAVPPAMPIISEGVPAYCSDTPGTAANANSTDYDLNWRSTGTPSVSQPAWLAYDLSSKAPKQVVVTWYNPSCYEYDYAFYAGTASYNLPNNLLQDYTIDVNAAPGGSVPTSGWVTMVTVTGNVYHSRSAVFDMTGYNWVRINCTAIAGSSPNDNASCHLDVYDARNGTEDTWLFLGDSITAGGMNLTGTVFAQAVNAGDGIHYPSQENGGMAGWTTGIMATDLSQFLGVSPGHYVTLSLGTNDINTYAGDAASIDSACNNLVLMANAVIAAGRVPIIPHVPWANTAAIQANAPLLNARIDALCAANPGILLGPDLFGYYNDNRSLISSDNLHPTSPAGFQAYRSYWAKWALWSVYAPVAVTEPVSQTVSSGQDASFTFSVSGEPATTTYQWYLNGTAIPSANQSTLVITGATTASAGDYTCTAMNSTGVKTSTTATLSVVDPSQLIDGAFIKGSNLPWLDGAYNTWIGIDPTEVSWGCAYNSAHVHQYFADLHSMGVTVVRIWINQGDEGNTIDSNDYVTGVTPLFWENMDDCVQQAANTGVKLYVTLNNGRSDWLENPVQAGAYMNNALIPMIQRYKGNPAVFAIDLMNEIEGAIAGSTGNWSTDGATWAQAQAYIRTFAAAVHTADPGRLVSCSSGWHAWSNLQNFKGLGLDFYDFHQYDDAGYIPPVSSLNMDRPVYVGECGQSTAVWDDAIQNAAELNFLNNARDGGYAGAGIWAYNYPGGTDYDQMVNADGSWRPVCYTIQRWGATAPALTSQPLSQTAAEGGTIVFRAAAAGTPAPTCQWQLSTDGGSSWTDLTDTAPYSGSMTGTLTITGDTGAMNGFQYRCVTTNAAGTSTSNAATLAVSTDQAFLQQLFRAVLGRDIDSGALAAFGAALAGGESRAAVLGDLLGSAEYSQWQIEPVIRLYAAALARYPDYAGLQNWSNALHAGMLTLAGAGDQFAASPEFLQKYGSLDDAGFVQQLYLNVLGRLPDTAGLNGWLEQLNAGTSRGTVLTGFSESPEFQADTADQVEIGRLYYLLGQRMPTAAEMQRWTAFLNGDAQTDTLLAQADPSGLANAAFVQAAFQGFLCRPVDAGALSTFSAALDVGAITRGSVVDTLLNSAEFNATVAPVSRLYLAAFHRVPDQTGLNNWVNYVRGGNSLQSAADAFVASAEFQLTYGSLDNTQFVTLLYENVLGREPDPDGLADWAAQLKNGATRGKILIGFSESQEGIALLAPTLRTFLHYFAFLNAPPSPSDLACWKNYLTTLDEQLRDDLLADPAFANGG